MAESFAENDMNAENRFNTTDVLPKMRPGDSWPTIGRRHSFPTIRRWGTCTLISPANPTLVDVIRVRSSSEATVPTIQPRGSRIMMPPANSTQVDIIKARSSSEATVPTIRQRASYTVMSPTNLTSTDAFNIQSSSEGIAPTIRRRGSCTVMSSTSLIPTDIVKVQSNSEGTKTKEFAARDKWDSDFVLDNDAQLVKSTIQLHLGQRMEDFEAMKENLHGKEDASPDHDSDDEVWDFPDEHPLRKGTNRFVMAKKNYDGIDNWDSDFAVGDDVASNGFQIYLHGVKKLGAVDMIKKDREGRDMWDSDYELEDQEVRLKLRGEHDVQLRLRGGQGVEDVDMEEDCSSPDLAMDDDDMLDLAFSQLNVNQNASSSNGSFGMPNAGGYRIQPSLVHPSGFKAVRQKQPSDISISPSDTHPETTKEQKQDNIRDVPQSTADSDLSTLKTSMVHPSGIKRVRARSEGGEGSKRQRTSGAGASATSKTTSEMMDDSMDWD